MYNYYNCLPIKPGVYIYKAIIESKLPLKHLKVNIPETLVNFNGVFWISKSISVTYIHHRLKWRTDKEIK